MKLNKRQFKRIIKEEIQRVMNEDSADYKAGAAIGRTICNLASKYAEYEEDKYRIALEAKIAEVYKSGKTTTFSTVYWRGILENVGCDELARSAGQVSELEAWIEKNFEDLS